MADQFANAQPGLSSPASKATAITTDDDNDLAEFARGIYVGGSGNITLIPVNQSASVTFQAVPVGTILPVRTKRVLATGTTATSLVGLS